MKMCNIFMDWKSLSISIRCQFSTKLRFNVVIIKVKTIMGGVWWVCGTCTAPLLWLQDKPRKNSVP